jgi:hypothetical protein
MSKEDIKKRDKIKNKKQVKFEIGDPENFSFKTFFFP